MTTLTRLRLTAGQWHEIGAGMVITQINHHQGNGKVVYTEALKGSALSNPYDGDTAIYMFSHVGDILYFTDVNIEDSIFVYPIYQGVDLTVAKD